MHRYKGKRRYLVAIVFLAFCLSLAKLLSSYSLPSNKAARQWKNNTSAPVLLFVDDLADSYVLSDTKKSGYLENDWGHYRDNANSAFSFLINEILPDFPELKVTFFMVVDSRSPAVLKKEIRQVSRPMNYTNEDIRFYSSLDRNNRFELAYHGTTHGIPGLANTEFIQEWLSFKNLDEALSIIAKGKEIYKKTVGHYPVGGKYCGYLSNGFSDESIDRSGFKWWCRYYNRSAIEGCNDVNYCGIDKNPLTAFNIKFFGKNNVIDIPTTISGDLFNRPLHTPSGIKGIIKKLLRPYLLKREYEKIDYLVKHHLIISIQEHISPIRNDGKRQAPNIFDDKESLIMIFNYLKNKKVWYCTGSELAEWAAKNIGNN